VPAETHAAAAVPAPDPASRPGAPRALVVDDESSVRSLVARLLGRRGFDVTQAEDGEAALRLLSEHAFDLVLCDVRMPRLNGRALYAEVSTHRPNMARAFVFMTGDTLSPDVAEFAAEHDIRLLTKPFTTRELEAVLEQLT
jgi:two-component system NtrC family sensor kinase